MDPITLCQNYIRRGYAFKCIQMNIKAKVKSY